MYQLTKTTGQPQGALMPEINAKKDIESRLSDLNNPNVDKPYIETCSGFETHTADPAPKVLP